MAVAVLPRADRECASGEDADHLTRRPPAATIASYRSRGPRMVTLFLSLLLAANVLGAPPEFELASPQATTRVLVPASEPECVVLAAEDLARDVERITGQRPAMVRRLEACGAQAVVLATAARPGSARLLARFLPDAGEALEGKWEAWRVRTVGAAVGPVRRALVIAGSDVRGTMFGLYTFCEKQLHVDPMHFWADTPPGT